jgi:hypothetical protein
LNGLPINIPEEKSLKLYFCIKGYTMNIYKIPKISFNKYLINISSRKRIRIIPILSSQFFKMSMKKHSFMPIDIKTKLVTG